MLTKICTQAPQYSSLEHKTLVLEVSCEPKDQKPSTHKELPTTSTNVVNHHYLQYNEVAR